MSGGDLIKKNIFLILFLFLIISAVSAADNATDDNVLSDSDDLSLRGSTDVPVMGDAESSTLSADDVSKNESGTDTTLKSPSGSVSKFSAKDVASKYGSKTTFSVKLLNKDGNVLKDKSVIFKVNGNKYSAQSDSKGIATVSLKLNAGKYTISYSCDGVGGKNTINVKNAYKIKIYKWKSGADIKKNKKIKKNIPDSKVVKKIVKAAKKGTPVIKFKGGKGKKVFITAGVHGNELSSQVAAMNLIKYLEDHPIKGTVYIMPFMNPKGTAKNVRDYNGVHLNKLANKKGTISYKTVKLITKFKCKAYGDFHCTKPGGKPGMDVAMGTYNPTPQSAVMARYIAKDSNVNYLIYKKAGSEYPGALEDTVSLKGIPAVTCEVITPHGKIAKGTPTKSLSMMRSFLKFNALI